MNPRRIDLVDLFLRDVESPFVSDLRDLGLGEALEISYAPLVISYFVRARSDDGSVIAMVEADRLSIVLERRVRSSSESAFLIQFDRAHPSVPIRGEPTARSLVSRLARQLASGTWVEPVYEIVSLDGTYANR